MRLNGRKLWAGLAHGLAVIVLCGPSFNPPAALAHFLADAPGGFDHNNLLTNEAFSAFGLDGAGVISLLGSKGSWLAGYRIPEHQEIPYKFRNSNGDCEWRSVSVRQFNDTTGEALYGEMAGDLIAKKAHDHGLNPQVVIATLEKESSAVTRSSPQSVPVEMWVLGYGWDDIMAACGYGYDAARRRALDFGGVGQQIAYGTFGLRSLFNKSTDWATPFTSGDGFVVTSSNQATRALYRYTPYVHNANHNFWYFYTLWFQTEPRFSPTAYGWDDEGKPSLVFGGVRWPFIDIPSFESYLPGHAGVMGPLGPAYLALPRKQTLGRLIRKGGDGGIFYLFNGQRRHVNSERVLRLYGWRPEDVVGNVDEKFIDALPVGDPLLPLVRIENSTTTYLQTRGENHRITSQAIFKDNWRLDWGEVIEVPPYVVNLRPTTNHLGFIALSNEGTAYLLDGGKRYHIPDQHTTERWGLDWNTAIRFDTPLLWRFPEDWRVTPYARNEETGHVYILEKGQRRWLSAKRQNELGIAERDIVNHTAAFLNRIAEGPHY